MKSLGSFGILQKKGMIGEMEYSKLQLGCLCVILYIAFNYYKERRQLPGKQKISMFDGILIVNTIYLILDGLTAYYVNYQEQISATLNRVLHFLFLLSLDASIFLMFLYMLSITGRLPKSRKNLLIVWSPFILNVIVLIVNIGSLEYRVGRISNYSMGIPVYTCFIMIGVYIVLSIAAFFSRWNYIESHKRISIFSYLAVLVIVTVYQMTHPDALISSIGATVVTLGIYVNQENPVMKKLSYQHSEMVMGYATLVENKDDSTGGHIKRTTMYVKLLAEELRDRDIYSDILTKDYMNDLMLAAPMHDIGKISVPDHILQKPGKLTDEEFDIMKQHAANGGKIIQETFGKSDQGMYKEVAYQVARNHHEKWNGRGYPDGLKGNEIPLGVRIMSIADVFDAVSQKRCYRDAMPLEQCFDIIEKGRGTDFEPVLVDIFLDIREKVEEVYRKFNDE